MLFRSGEAKSFIGIQIERNRQNRTIRLHQRKYLEEILEHFGMDSCNGLNVPLDRSIKLVPATSEDILKGDDVTKYQSIVRKLMYGMIATRPNLAFAVSTLGRFNAAPTIAHLGAAKKTLRYLKQTLNVGISYGPSSSNNITGLYSNDLIGFSDSD